MKEIYHQLAEAVKNMNAAEVIRLSERVLSEGFPPEEAIEKGLAAGMNLVGELFAAKECFVPEILVSSRAMYAGFNILKHHVVEGKIHNKGAIAIGVVDGDYHDIGKNIVKLMLEASGFRLIDLGKNVPQERFEAAAAAENPLIIALSTLMTTTMDNMAQIVSSIKTAHPNVKIMVGGAPLSPDFARSIGAHHYGKDAREAVTGAHELLGIPL